MTVLEAIQRSAEFLGKKSIESPRLQAELLLAHVLKLPRMKLYLNFERELTVAETNTMRELVKRRAQREPLQHIVGSTSFCGLDIAVTRSVLIPRPETELLAEEGWQFLEGRAGSPLPAERRTPYHELMALDFGTGSGCIAIALAARCPSANIVALDFSLDALEVAKQNALKNNVAERIEFLHSDGFAALNSVREGRHVADPNLETAPRRPSQFDLIISNPPYIPTAEIEQLEPEVRDFDPRSALDGGADGLDFYRRFAKEAGAFLKPDGKIMLEFGDDQGDAIKIFFETEKWIVEPLKQDYTRRSRILIARR